VEQISSVSTQSSTHNATEPSRQAIHHNTALRFMALRSRKRPGVEGFGASNTLCATAVRIMGASWLDRMMGHGLETRLAVGNQRWGRYQPTLWQGHYEEGGIDQNKLGFQAAQIRAICLANSQWKPHPLTWGTGTTGKWLESTDEEDKDEAQHSRHFPRSRDLTLSKLAKESRPSGSAAHRPTNLQSLFWLPSTLLLLLGRFEPPSGAASWRAARPTRPVSQLSFGSRAATSTKPFSSSPPPPKPSYRSPTTRTVVLRRHHLLLPSWIGRVRTNTRPVPQIRLAEAHGAVPFPRKTRESRITNGTHRNLLYPRQQICFLYTSGGCTSPKSG
ncbi:hypothetical protein VP01_4799g1, partial [Puccinia sorghi]